MRKSLVSLVALGLFIGAPALADTAKSTATQGTSTQATATQSTSADQMGLLSGYEQRSEIQGGQLAWGSTSDGDDLLLFAMPPVAGSAGAQDSDIGSRLQGAGFSQLKTLEDARIARAELDGDHYIFALSAAQMSKFAGKASTQSGTTMSKSDTSSDTGQTSRALSEPGADRIVSDLEEAGLADAKEFKGRLVRAMGEDGSPVFFIITSKDMGSDAEVAISEGDVRRKLEESNFKDVEFVVDAKIVRGSLGDEQVFVLAGDLMGEGGQQ